jgi:hypothetical protein
MTDHRLQLGEVSTAAGVSVDTVRSHECERLLPSTGRTLGGARQFEPDAVDRIRQAVRGFRLTNLSGGRRPPYVSAEGMGARRAEAGGRR